MGTKIIIFILAFFVWLLLTWPVSTGHIFAAVIIAAFISLMTSDIFERKAAFSTNIMRYLWFLWYIPLFIWECIKANLDGAYRLIHPDCPIRPGIVKVKTSLKSDTGLTFLANTLTLKPGTMTVDIDKEAGFLYVHWVDVKSRDIEKNTELIVRKFETILRKIFE